MYETYQQFINRCLSDDALFQNFKNVYAYREILEHVSFDLGLAYLIHIWNEFHLDTPLIVDYCSKNDAIGNTHLYEYATDLKCSPTSIRYIYHALLILKQIKSLNLESVDIVEVGCGYGGLCLAIDHYSKQMG